MKKLKWNIWLILLADLLLIIVGGLNTVNVYHRAGLPFPTDSDSDTVWIAINQDTVIEKFQFDTGDIVVTVDKKEVTNLREIEYILDFHNKGDIVPIGIKTGDVLKTGYFKLIHYYKDIDVIIFIITSILMFFVAFICLISKPDQKSAVIFHHAAFAAGMMVLMTWGKIGYFPMWMDIFCRILYEACFIFTPILFFHFSFYFPKETESGIKRYIKFAHIAGILTLTFISISIIQSVHQFNLDVFIKYQHYHSILARKIFIPVFFVWGVINFIISYRKSSDIIDKRKLLWILTGVSIGPIVFMIFWIIPHEIDQLHFMMIPEWLMTILVGISPITMAIGILRYRLFDIEFIINRGTVYFVVLAAMSGLFIGVFVLLNMMIHNYTSDNEIYPELIASIVVAFIFQPVKSRVQRFIDKRFFKINYNYRAAQQEFVQSINQCYNIDSVAQLCINTIMRYIPVELSAFLSYHSDLDRYIMLAGSNFIYDVGNITKITNISRYYPGQTVFAQGRYMEAGINYIPDESGILNVIGGELFLTSVDSKREPISLIIVGKKKSGFKFTVEDIGMLTMINHQSSEAINRINLQIKLGLKEEEARRLEELSNMKSYFVSSVSHELKTPLTSIRLFAEIMQIKKNLDEDKKAEYLGIIESECDRLNRLIGNVLDFSKIERGVKEYSFIRISLTDILRDVIKTFEYQFKAQRFKVNVDISDEPIIINGDQDAISECLINLISNAMKYSFDNKEISIKSYKTQEFNIITIEDKGCGISTSDLEHIFEPFFRSKDISQTGGAGIGLSLVRNNMLAHKGQIKVSSQPGHGSKFSLLFPLMIENEL